MDQNRNQKDSNDSKNFIVKLSLSSLVRTLHIEFSETYWKILNSRCSPYVCKILQDEEIDLDTFMLLNKNDLIKLRINRSDVKVLDQIKRLLNAEIYAKF